MHGALSTPQELEKLRNLTISIGGESKKRGGESKKIGEVGYFHRKMGANKFVLMNTMIFAF